MFEIFDKDLKDNSLNEIKSSILKIKQLMIDLIVKTDDLYPYLKVEFSNSIFQIDGSQNKLNNFESKIKKLYHYVYSLKEYMDAKKIIIKIDSLENIS